MNGMHLFTTYYRMRLFLQTSIGLCNETITKLLAKQVTKEGNNRSPEEQLVN